mgnify:CR=1 FL=1
MPEKVPRFTAYEPVGDLQLFIHRFMYGCCDDDHPVSITIPPTGGIFLSYVAGAPLRIRMREQETQTQSRLFIGGQLRHETPVLTSRGRFRLLGIEFRPTGFYRLLHQDADAFTDRMTDFAEAFPQFARDLGNRLAPADTTRQLIATLETFLLGLIPRALGAPIVESAIDVIVAKQGLIKVEELSALTGYGVRQLHRYFLAATGIPPKHYAKIVQINSVVSALMAEDTIKLQELSLEYGYFDHAHFIHDFQRFVHTNPSAFLSAKSAFLSTFLGNIAH